MHCICSVNMLHMGAVSCTDKDWFMITWCCGVQQEGYTCWYSIGYLSFSKLTSQYCLAAGDGRTPAEVYTSHICPVRGFYLPLHCTYPNVSGIHRLHICAAWNKHCRGGYLLQKCYVSKVFKLMTALVNNCGASWRHDTQ